MEKEQKSRRQQAEKRGRTAENIAVVLLRLKGYTIIAQRFKGKQGEIDIIAQRGMTIAFVEVKARKTTDEALYSLSFRQRRRIEAAATEWLQQQGSADASLRFDMITVAQSGIPSHMTDAWRLGE